MSDSYPTDKWIRDLFPEHHDPCPLAENWQPDDDGLAYNWRIKTFCNPPYSNPLPWVMHGIMSNKMFKTQVVFLLKHDSSTKWYRALHEAGAKFLMVQGRLKHGTNNAAPFPSILVVLS